MPERNHQKVAIIGAGAAGCFAAANIPYQEGREVVLFEKTGKALQKVLVSGGGRCNVTHACFDVNELSGRYPRGKQLLRKTLHHFGPTDTVRWFKDRGLALHTEADGRMFPVTNSSQSIIDSIWHELQRQRVQVLFHKGVTGVSREEDGRIRLQLSDGSHYIADKVLVAVGGYPKKEQYAWLQTTGHQVIDPVPSLFTFNLPGHPVTQLMGVATEVHLKIAGTKFTEQGPLLITHWGFSGPAVLRCSAWAARALQEQNYQFTVLINWLKGATDEDFKEQLNYLRREEGKQLVHQRNPFGLPRRLWEHFTARLGISESLRWGELPAALQNKLAETLLRDAYTVKGKTTFKEEFVTCGGIALPEINPQTMESRLFPGLYFAGEVTDVDGITGGFNFQNAWTSAWLAAKAMQE